jgi:hypothetical protein
MIKRAALLRDPPGGVEIFVTAAAWHDIPLLATMVHQTVISQVISGARPIRALPVTCRRAPDARRKRRRAPGRSPDLESLITPAWRVPDLSDSVHVAGCVGGAEPVQQAVAILKRPLCHYLHSAVVEIERKAGEAADLQSVCPGEPAKAHLLYSTAYPDDKPCIFVHA